MTTNGVGQTNSTANTPALAGIQKSALGQDAFLQLLTTQLANQDPTAPQDNGQMIAQLAQFSSLEQLTQIQKTLQAISVALGVAATPDPSDDSDASTAKV